MGYPLPVLCATHISLLLALASPIHPTMAPPPRLFRDTSVPMSKAMIPRATEHRSKAPHRLFLAFDGLVTRKGGISDATRNLSPFCGTTVPAFDHTPYGNDRAAVIRSVESRVAALLAAYAVDVVIERPDAPPFDLMAVGGKPAICGLSDGLGGFSPQDCGDRSPSDIGYVFSADVTNLDMLAVVIVHEFGHLKGLVHTEEPCDIMSNLLCDPREKRFWDDPVAISLDHQGRCFPIGSRVSSHDLMSERVGGRVPARDAGPDSSSPPDAPPPTGAQAPHGCTVAATSNLVPAGDFPVFLCFLLLLAARRWASI